MNENHQHSSYPLDKEYPQELDYFPILFYLMLHHHYIPMRKPFLEYWQLDYVDYRSKFKIFLFSFYRNKLLELVEEMRILHLWLRISHILLIRNCRVFLWLVLLVKLFVVLPWFFDLRFLFPFINKYYKKFNILNL